MSIEERAAKLMPNWSYWGSGVVLVPKNNWLKSRRRMESLLQQVSRSKKQIIELRKGTNNLKEKYDSLYEDYIIIKRESTDG